MRLNDFIENNGAVILVKEDHATNGKFKAEKFWSQLPSLGDEMAYTGLDVTTVKSMKKTLDAITHRRLASRSMASGMVLSFGDVVQENVKSEEDVSPQQPHQNSVFCGVKLYSAYVKSRLARAQLLDGATNEVVRPQTRYFLTEEEEENEEVEPQAASTANNTGYYYYGAEKLPVSPEEMLSFRSSQNAKQFVPKIKLLYTCPRIALDMECHIQTSAFLYPDEKVIHTFSERKLSHD